MSDFFSDAHTKGRPDVVLLTPGNGHDCEVVQRCMEAMQPYSKLVANKGHDNHALRSG